MAWVSNAPLRKAFLRDETNAHQLALRLGVVRPDYKRPGRLLGDACYVKRALGLAPGTRGEPPQQYMREATAERFCEALNLDPVDIGL